MSRHTPLPTRRPMPNRRLVAAQDPSNIAPRGAAIARALPAPSPLPWLDALARALSRLLQRLG